MKIKKFLIIFSASLILYSCDNVFKDDENTIDPREKLNDLWRCTEESEIYGKSSYDEVYIYNHPTDSLSIYIENFYNLGENNRVKHFSMVKL